MVIREKLRDMLFGTMSFFGKSNHKNIFLSRPCQYLFSNFQSSGKLTKKLKANLDHIRDLSITFWF